ncbi:hypothetical protein D9619_011105 [Psilocybe cf. subviscida]|uniref:Uncharacterized protein n=1 Tax=Psilocybe cf. subviscida TaxID=2480587 RepID=A0A8H5BK70_9AGAR|nr:hypothetical protein D9619_011105 [Psilocybe cf. subviscida]
MKISAVLLLIGLSMAMVQAVPVPTRSTMTTLAASGSHMTATESESHVHGEKSTHPGADLHAAPEVEAMLEDFYTTSPHHNASPIHTGKQVARDEENTVVLVSRFNLGKKIKSAFHHVGKKIKHAVHKVGHAIKHVVHKAGHAIKHGAKKVVHAVKHGAKKVVHKVKHVVKKVKNYVKHNGSTIAKVALKGTATAAEVAGKVAPFTSLGPAAGKALEKGGHQLNKASNAIHAPTTGNVGKAIHGMNAAQTIVGLIP